MTVRISRVALWTVWLVSRIVLYLIVTAPHNDGDVGIYQQWYACCLSHGTFPVTDPRWQYPPGAGLVLWLPGRVPGGYVSDFVLLAIGCDLVVTLVLCARATRNGSMFGAWYWVLGVPLLGGIAVARLDIVPVALSVAALCLPDRRGSRGVLIGAAAAIKIWPVTLLAGSPPGRLRRDLAVSAVTAAAICGAFAGATGSFLAHQANRGVEIEAVPATPLMIWRLIGWAGRPVYRFGAYQLDGPYSAAVIDACRIGLVLAGLAVLCWRLRVASGQGRWRPEFAADAPLAATLLFLVVSPVLSPQYLLWIIGLSAACLATGRTTQGQVAIAVPAVIVLTLLVFPTEWSGLIAGSVLPTLVLAARNSLLLVITFVSCWRIIRAGSGELADGHRPGRPAGPAPLDDQGHAEAAGQVALGEHLGDLAGDEHRSAAHQHGVGEALWHLLDVVRDHHQYR
jgi:hypothetical protein